MSCKHDCAKPPLFPRAIFNRPGLTRIDYRIGNYAEVRAHLFDALNQQAALAAFTHRHVDDPAIALIEADAIIVDILSFYQSLYANEAYLRTAQWPDSISELVRLGGYRLAPGIAGEATFALTIKGNTAVTVPKGFGLKAQIEGIAKPVEFETRAALQAHPALGSFALYRPRYTPSIQSGTRVLRLASASIDIKQGDRLMLGEASPAGSQTERLLQAQIVTVDQTWVEFGQRHVQLTAPLNRSAAINMLSAYKIGETVRHFGHNAPTMISTVNAQGVPSTRATSYLRRVDATTTAMVEPNLGKYEMPLDRESKAFPVGTTVIVQGRFGSNALGAATFRTLIRRVTAAEDRSLTWGMQTGSCTLLSLHAPGHFVAALQAQFQPIAAPFAPSPFIQGSGPTVYAYAASYVEASALRYADIRTLNFTPVVGDAFQVYAADRDTTATQGNTLRYYGLAEHAATLSDRRLLISIPDAAPLQRQVTSVATAAEDDASFHDITLDAALDYDRFGYEEATTIVYGNVVDASQGKTLEAVAIGSGDARAQFQSFALPKPPLTYLFDATRTPAQTPELEIRVDGLRWTRVETLFDASPLDQVYIVREDADGQSVVQFGDGKTGAKPNSGRNNIVALLRTGSGAHGPLQEGAKPNATGKLAALDKVHLPQPVTTGAAPESAENARTAAPVRLQSLGRLVSLADYEAETLMLPNVLKASARWDAPEGSPAIVLTVLTASGSEADIARVRDALSVFSRCRGSARYPVIVRAGYRQYLHVDALVGFDPAYRGEDLMRGIRLALGVIGEEANGIDGKDGLFGLSTRNFHQSAHTSQIVAAIQNVPGVRWVELRAAQTLPLGAPPEPDPSQLPLPAQNLILSASIPCPLQALLTLHTRHLVIGLVADQAITECSP